MSTTVLPTVTWQGLEIDGDVRRVRFNQGPGEILFSGSIIPDRAQQVLRFVSGSPGTSGRAWQYESILNVREVATGSAYDNALFGFIQTVEYYTCVGEYANDVRVYFGAEQARDSTTVSVPAPWFGAEGSPMGPASAPGFTALAHPLQLEDAPQVAYHAYRNGSPIRRVALEGVFGLRLIGFDPNLGLSLPGVAILFHAQIRVALLFVQNGSDPPTFDLSWTRHGSVRVLREGAGRGPGIIVLQGALARRQLAAPAATDSRRPFGSWGR